LLDLQLAVLTKHENIFHKITASAGGFSHFSIFRKFAETQFEAGMITDGFTQ